MKINTLKSYIKNATLSASLRTFIMDNYRQWDAEDLLRQEISCDFAVECGIYRIVNLETNRSYIGKSKNMPARLRQHFHQLKYGKHPCKPLQEDYDRLGREYFDKQVLDSCKVDELHDKEVHWHKEYAGNLYSSVYKMFNVPIELWDDVQSLLDSNFH